MFSPFRRMSAAVRMSPTPRRASRVSRRRTGSCRSRAGARRPARPARRSRACASRPSIRRRRRCRVRPASGSRCRLPPATADCTRKSRMLFCRSHTPVTILGHKSDRAVTRTSSVRSTSGPRSAHRVLERRGQLLRWFAGRAPRDQKHARTTGAGPAATATVPASVLICDVGKSRGDTHDGERLLRSPRRRRRVNRLPMASAASAFGKSWSASVFEMSVTISAPARSSAVKPRPRSSGMPIVSRYPSPTRVTCDGDELRGDVRVQSAARPSCCGRGNRAAGHPPQ